MNSMNHILIGTIVYEYLNEKYGIVLNKSRFLTGNTCPDHGISFLRPHKMRYCDKMVRRKMERFCRKDYQIIGAKASKKLGILCHYYSDFFCCAHSPQFSGNIKEHVRYENELLQFMREHYSAFRGMDYVPYAAIPASVAEINNRMCELIGNRPVKEYNFGAELFSAIQACAELVLFVCLTVLSQYSQVLPQELSTRKTA
ncbi:zinc dependent phospholipase C family protein [Caproiciproducens faecalis]|uniref:Zinc dependent phospholipase C family protein n=1 Tax=Caproiciproducens faecalis TaxID=2820301 RepID=A0ABS7DQD5_9FIRM|nr:zinc dependent phospholipase C family protein [Caproiciproducens faecalis]MBW7573506.1 zinc dependent phospholipase C family protein [Caproiciproducens faecalis]